MAARNKARPYTLDRDITTLYGGGTGAGDNTDMTSIVGAGISSIEAAAANGKYTITLTDKWSKLLNATFMVIDSSGTDQTWDVIVLAESVASAKTISIQTRLVAASGPTVTATGLTTGQKLKITLALCDTAQPPTAR